VSIFGADFCPFSLDWNRELSFGRLPTVLMGLRVTFAGKPAVISYISPNQVNVQAPNVEPGSVPVVVAFNNETSVPFIAQARVCAPAFFHWAASSYAVATRYPDNAYLGGPSLGPPWTAANPGDIVILWATGFGPTQPSVPPGVIVPAPALTSTTPALTVAGLTASVLGAALSPGLIGVYQLAFEVPTGAPPGDANLKASIAGTAAPTRYSM